MSLTARLAAVVPGTAPSVVFASTTACPITFTWPWVSYGGALSHGALCGREPPRTVLPTSVSDTYVVTNTLGKYFLPWTVTRAAWTAVLRPGVSGITTDMMLFHQHGARLVHRYRVYADNLPHRSLRGFFMLRLARFTLQASCVEARSATKHGRDSRSELAHTLLGHAHHTPDSTPPAWRSACAAATVTSTADVSADAPVPARAAPADGPVSPGLLRPIIRVSLPLSVVSAPGPAPALVMLPEVASALQRSPPLPGSRTSTPAYVLFPTDIDAQISALQGADVAVPPGFEPINLSVSQVSKFSVVPLSLSRVCPDFDGTREGQCSLSATSPMLDGHLSPVSPATPRVSSPIESGGITSHSIVLPIDRYLSWLPLYFVRGCLILRLTTLGSGINRVVVPTGSRRIGTTNTLIWIACVVCRFTTHNSWSG